jgi:hypothetical protein
VTDTGHPDGRPIIDIADPVATICRSFDLDPDDVAELRIRPSEAWATVYQRDDNGAKYLDPTKRAPVVAILEFRISTSI